MDNDSQYFSLYHEKPSICNVYVKFHNNILSFAEILLFVKDGRTLPFFNTMRIDVTSTT